MNYQGRNEQREGAGRLSSRAAPILSSKAPPPLLRIAGLVARAVFLVVFSVVALSVSFPQDVTSRPPSHYSFVEFVRCAIGIAICAAMMVKLTQPPRGGADGYKAWAFVGLLMATVLIIFTTLKLVFAA
jgi:hypothetical protein